MCSSAGAGHVRAREAVGQGEGRAHMCVCRRRRRCSLDPFSRLDQMFPLLPRSPRALAHLHRFHAPARAGQIERKACHGARSSRVGPRPHWAGESGPARTEQAAKKQRLTLRRLAGRGYAPALERTRGAVADARCRKQRWSRHCEGGHARERGARSQGGSQHERGPETAEHWPRCSGRQGTGRVHRHRSLTRNCALIIN